MPICHDPLNRASRLPISARGNFFCRTRCVFPGGVSAARFLSARWAWRARVRFAVRGGWAWWSAARRWVSAGVVWRGWVGCRAGWRGVGAARAGWGVSCVRGRRRGAARRSRGGAGAAGLAGWRASAAGRLVAFGVGRRLLGRVLARGPVVRGLVSRPRRRGLARGRRAGGCISPATAASRCAPGRGGRRSRGASAFRWLEFAARARLLVGAAQIAFHSGAWFDTVDPPLLAFCSSHRSSPLGRLLICARFSCERMFAASQQRYQTSAFRLAQLNPDRNTSLIPHAEAVINQHAPNRDPSHASRPYLAFIHPHSARQSPAEADMQRFFQVTSPSVHQMVLSLEKAGLITRQPGIARSITLTIDPADLPELTSPIHTNPSNATLKSCRQCDE